MEFSDLARQEATAFVDRLVAAADAMRVDLERRLGAVSTELEFATEAHRRVDAQRMTAEAAVAEQSAARAYEAAAREEEATARLEAEQELHATRELLERSRQEAAAVAERIRGLEQVLATARDTETSLRAELSETERSLRAQLETANDRGNERAAAVEAAAKMAADAAAQQFAAERDALRAKVEAAAGEIEQLRSEYEAAGSDLRDAQTQLDASHEHYCRIEQRLRDAQASATSMLTDAIAANDALDAAETTAALFEALAEHVARVLKRVAIFRVKGSHLEGEHVAAPDDRADVRKLVIPMSVASLVTRAATSGDIHRAEGEQLNGLLSPFGDTPAAALAVALSVGGERIAVLYADAGSAVSDTDAAYARLLVRYATVVLSRLTHELRAMKELQEYAAMLLQEAEGMFQNDVATGRSESQCVARLRETLECGRELYAQRAALEGTIAADLLEEQIAATIRESDSRFARALADAVETPEARRTAS